MQKKLLKLGNNTLRNWIGHSNVKIVLPQDTMDEKIRLVLNIINDLLKEKQVKRQIKFAVSLSDTDMEKIVQNGRVMHIEQTYLQSDAKTEKRIRKVSFDNCDAYYFSVYKILDDGSIIIVSEKSIDKKVYEQLLEFKDDDYEILDKDRYYFVYDGQYFSLDVFRNNNEIGILEINFNGDNIKIPSYVRVIDEVTSDKNFYNKNMARKCRKELKKV